MHKCPRCQTVNSVRLSTPRVWEVPLKIVGIRTFRCRACSKRIYRTWAIHPEPQAELATPANLPATRKIAVPAPADIVRLVPASLGEAGPEPVLESKVPAARQAPGGVAQAWTPPARKPPPLPENYRAATKDSTAEFSMVVRPSNSLKGFVEAWVPFGRPVAARGMAEKPRGWTFAGIPYFLKGYAVLVVVHFTVGILEFQRLGIAAMWFNLDSLVFVVASILIGIGLNLARASSAPEAVTMTAALVARWCLCFLVCEVGLSFFVVPDARGFHASRLFFHAQSPWIWSTYGVLPAAGILGCGGYLFLRSRLKS